jgi:hypothetical protein
MIFTKEKKMTAIQKIDEAIKLLSKEKKIGEYSHAMVLGYLMSVATDEQAEFVLGLAKEKVSN